MVDGLVMSQAPRCSQAGGCGSGLRLDSDTAWDMVPAMDHQQRSEVLQLLRLAQEVADHGLRAEGRPIVSGAVRRQRISYVVPGGARLTAWILHPSTGNGPWPGLLALHPHSDAWALGGDEVAGQLGSREHHYGLALAAQGFCVMCPDLPCFGQQGPPPGMPGHRWEELQLSRQLVVGRSLLSESLDQLRSAVAALLDFEGTADLTVAALGYGMGARVAAWLAFVDRRIGAVWMHAGIGQQQVLLGRGLLLPRHSLLPGLWNLGLDQADIVADVLPRGLGISYGRSDRITPAEAVAPVLAAVQARAAGLDQVRLTVVEGDYDHRFPAEVLAAAGDWLLA